MEQNPEKSSGILDQAEQKKAGEDYARFIEDLVAGRKTEDGPTDPVMAELVQKANVALERQQVAFVAGGYTPEKLLQEALPEASLSETAAAKIDNPSTGIVILKLGYSDFKKLRPKSRACASFRNPDLAFVLSPGLGDKRNREFLEREEEENLPHEIHHIVWRMGAGLDLLGEREIDAERKLMLNVFVDEVIATVVSDGKLHGHCQRNRLTEELIRANELLEDIDDLLKRTTFRKTDLIRPLLELKSMEELIQLLTRVKEQLEKIATPRQNPEGNGWTSIHT